MDGNKDEADRCIQIALRCIQAGDREKARKFLTKAQRLYPSDRVRELLARVTNVSNGSAAGPEEATYNGGADDASGAQGPRQRKSSGSTAAGAAGADVPEAKYTSDQLNLVRKITKCKDYYEILGVAKDCGEDDLKKAYRKLALKLHPDKNHAPGATEAFKAVGKAFGVLNDAEKRKRYDMYGSEAERATSSSRRGGHGHSHNGYYEFDDDISAEEIFNMFFGGAFPSNNVRTRRMYTNRDTFNAGHHHHHNQGDAQRSAFFLQLAPIFMLLAVSILSAILTGDPTYSLSRSSKYNMERHTQNLRIQYYVKPDFSTEYKGSMRRLEQQVEEDFISTLRSNCFKERSYKENMLWRARNFGDGKLYEKAQNLKTPSCDRLQSIYA